MVMCRLQYIASPVFGVEQAKLERMRGLGLLKCKERVRVRVNAYRVRVRVRVRVREL